MNKIAMITGASSGIGKSCAVLFAKNGINLIIATRRVEKLTDEDMVIMPTRQASATMDIKNYGKF